MPIEEEEEKESNNSKNSSFFMRNCSAISEESEESNGPIIVQSIGLSSGNKYPIRRQLVPEVSEKGVIASVSS